MPPSILIVDDDPDIRTVVRVAAEKAGMLVHEAGDGRLALEQLRHTDIDLVVLDVGMPVMNGFECCKAIRAHSRVPVLFLTAQDDEIDRVLGSSWAPMTMSPSRFRRANWCCGSTPS